LYYGFYKLTEDPFRLTPDPSFIYMTQHHREALAGLIYSTCTRTGLTALIGEVGTGKTTLLYSLLGMLEKRRFVTALCTNPTLTREEFYDYLLLKLGVSCSSSLKSRQLVALHEHLLRTRSEGRPSVLVVDEAQRLSPELLEEIRLLLNLETPREKLLEIIIAGQPELWEILRRLELRQLKQRISYFCKLEPLTREEVGNYINYRLARAGLPEQDVFSPAVIEAIHKYSHGIPRLINSLCNTALRYGFADQVPRITISHIREAVKELDLDSPPFGGTPEIDEEAVVPIAGSDFSLGASEASDAGNSVPETRIPLEGYGARLKNRGFFSNMRDRWK
jgi:general secretion pathway protein A